MFRGLLFWSPPVFWRYRIRLIEDARHAWKWSSMRFLALGVTVQGAVVSADRIGISAHIPDWVLSAASTFAFGCMILAGVGRLTTVEKANGPR